MDEKFLKSCSAAIWGIVSRRIEEGARGTGQFVAMYQRLLQATGHQECLYRELREIRSEALARLAEVIPPAHPQNFGWIVLKASELIGMLECAGAFDRIRLGQMSPHE